MSRKHRRDPSRGHRQCDPVSMSPEERLCEVAALLARGLSRRSLRAQVAEPTQERQKDLDSSAE